MKCFKKLRTCKSYNLFLFSYIPCPHRNSKWRLKFSSLWDMLCTHPLERLCPDCFLILILTYSSPDVCMVLSHTSFQSWLKCHCLGDTPENCKPTTPSSFFFSMAFLLCHFFTECIYCLSLFSWGGSSSKVRKHILG